MGLDNPVEQGQLLLDGLFTGNHQVVSIRESLSGQVRIVVTNHWTQSHAEPAGKINTPLKSHVRISTRIHDRKNDV
jgi:hypothetical protein